MHHDAIEIRIYCQAQLKLQLNLAELAKFSIKPAGHPHPPRKVYFSANLHPIITKLEIKISGDTPAG
jgi:hypothetical protein